VEWSSEIGEMDLYTHQDGDEFRIMIISTQGKCISPGDKPLFTFEGERDFDSVEVWVSDEEGNLVGVRKLYQDRSNLPLGYALSQNYPNPFNPITRIRYRVGGDEQVADNSAPHISLKVYNLLGQMVKVLVDEEKLPGDYQVFWDGKDESQERVSSGIYFYRFKCNGYVETKKMILLR
jgi:hypothetical protein